MNFSASELVKYSAKKIVYLVRKQIRIKTWMWERGVVYQKKIVEKLGIEAEEFRGCVTYKGHNIFFCVDGYKDNVFYEIKSFLDEDGNEKELTEQDMWFYNQSIVQCAFYKSLLILSESDVLFTPKFRLKEGYEFKTIKFNKNNRFVLLFGNLMKREVDVLDPNAIFDYYCRKIDAIEELDYDKAKAFDHLFKHKDWDNLKQYIK